ncbi:alpha/beta hydrolase [Brumimicrobium glaciale]|uniref:Alpha/beta hydrolase n=1 Tax=Brumimicrobium glaciale TaxID=200475 RepID=A0A4Q4KSN0_9FLAO|nr:alpha/beta hydrolase [Brumimicrobium glaciale]RYM36075.1 alpha/beta hydrolase [Brumimicrobium glaciale]
MEQTKLKIFTLILFLFSFLLCRAGNIETIYFLPGQGSDKRIFDSLEIDSKFKLKYLEYDTISKKVSLYELAKQLSTSIDTTENFALIGVSLGGMLSVELSRIVNPKKVIIISSAKNRKELPFRYRFQRVIPLFEIFPAKVIYWGAKTLQPIVEPDRNTNEDTFKSMLERKNPKYLKRTARMIIRWKRKTNSTKIIHVHGNNDHTIPIRNVVNLDYIIEDGSHMMALTRSKEISLILNREL